MTAGDHDICAICGHYKFLHLNSFKRECDACDDPAVPMDKRCPGYSDKKEIDNAK